MNGVTPLVTAVFVHKVSSRTTYRLYSGEVVVVADLLADSVNIDCFRDVPWGLLMLVTSSCTPEALDSNTAYISFTKAEPHDSFSLLPLYQIVRRSP
jgi:hypothetical protein